MTGVLQSVLLVCLSALCVECAPQVPAAARRTLFEEPYKAVPGPEKNYTGTRVRPDSTLLLYHHEQTIAVVEVGLKRALLNCELLEVKTKSDKAAALSSLQAIVPHHVKISFPNMKNLMDQCQQLEIPKTLDRKHVTASRALENTEARGLTSIFSGVFPGTKWCGTGDIAGSYFDIGEEGGLDKCCRTHDLCPVKVAGFKTQYNITNYSPYTRSHCDCDDHFYKCLKSVQTPVASLLGNIYFNVAQVTCIADLPATKRKGRTRRTFKLNNKRF